MSYNLKTIQSLCLVTKTYPGTNLSDSLLILSKREVQELIKSAFAFTIKEINKIEITKGETVSKKHFLPKNWQKLNEHSQDYLVWKEIAESEE